jgi:rSAM/selenodomain-associated transferase 1
MNDQFLTNTMSNLSHSKNLLIVFVKNSILGKVKTRLAKTIGDEAAFQIYNELVAITERETQKVNADQYIYFSDMIVDSKWKDDQKFVQEGADLGIRMQNAFLNGFAQGYEKIIVIGSDLPDISKEVIEAGFDQLNANEIVFGPADDGGYYLLGMSEMTHSIFENKPWSQSTLLNLTLQELSEQQKSVELLPTLNDIDTFEDLIASDFYQTNKRVQKIVQQLTLDK